MCNPIFTNHLVTGGPWPQQGRPGQTALPTGTPTWPLLAHGRDGGTFLHQMLVNVLGREFDFPFLSLEVQYFLTVFSKRDKEEKYFSSCSELEVLCHTDFVVSEN